MRQLARPAMYVGVFTLVFGLSKYHAAYIGDYDFTDSFRFTWAIAYAVGLCVVSYALGFPDLPGRLRSRLPLALVAAALGSLMVSAVQLFAGDALLPRFVVFGSAALLVPWLYGVTAVSAATRSRFEERDRVVIVGPLDLEEELTAELGREPERPARVVARLSEMDASATADSRPLVEAVVNNRGTVVVLSTPAQSDESVVDQAAVLHESGVRVRTRSLFFEEWLGKIPVLELGRVALFFDIGEVHRERYGRFKRLVDVVIGLCGTVALLMLIPIVAIANVIANRGPLFYVQDRVGRGGTVFRIYKFRSMRPDPSCVSQWTAADDPRVTPFGRLLRRTHLDEVPQVWNILVGDLSLVGPRPEQPRYVAELAEKLPFYHFRHIVRPGLTGWAQVKYGYAGDEQDALEKLQYDFHYLRRQSMMFDLRIIGRTLRSLAGGEGMGR